MSSSAAKPIGNCPNCGATRFENLVHHCSTVVRIDPTPDWQFTTEPVGDPHALCCSSCAALAARLAAVEAALREVWFRDDDYEIPGLLSMDYEIAPSDGSQPEWDDPRWAWADHPWLGLLGITEAECHAFFDARNAAARAALASEAARPEELAPERSNDPDQGGASAEGNDAANRGPANVSNLWVCHPCGMIGNEAEARAHRIARGHDVDELDAETSQLVREEWTAQSDPRRPNRHDLAVGLILHARAGSEAARPETGWASSELRRAEADKASLPSYVESAAGSEAAHPEATT